MINPKICRINFPVILFSLTFFWLISTFSVSTAQIVPPYLNGFENDTDTVGWTHMATGGVDDWEWGIPNDYYFAPAPEGSKAWGTNLDGDNELDAQRHLITPYFDLSNTTVDYVMTFQNVRHATGPIGGFSVEYNLAGSSSWIVLYNASVDKLNWQGTFGYNTNQLEPTTAKTSLSWVQGNDSIRFRFTRSSYTSTGGEGWEIDNFQIRHEVNNYTAMQGDTIFHVTKNFTEIEVESPVLFVNEFSTPIAVVNKYYWSSDPVLDGGDLFIGSQNLNSSGGFHPMSQTIAIPPNLNVGMYYVISSADATNLLPESNELDNLNYTVVVVDSLYSVPFITDFEAGSVEWATSSIGPTYDWHLDTPDQWHVHNAHSGTNAWIGPQQSWGPPPAQYIETPYLDLTGSTNTTFCLWFYTNSSNSNYLGNAAFIEMPEPDGPAVTHPLFYPTTSTPSNIEFKNQPIYDWRCTCIDVSAFDNDPSTKFRIYCSSNLPIDDVYIGPPKPDAAIQGFTDNRFTSSSLTTDTLWYAYFNSGMETLNSCQTNFYWSTDSLFDGSDILLDAKTEPVLSDTSFINTYFVYTKINSTPGIFYIIANADANNDIAEMREYDNQKVFKVYQQNTMSLPYFNDFETQITDWRHNASRHEDNWIWGDPEGTDIDTAFSGVKAWYTGANGIVASGSRMHLFTPVYDLTQLSDPVMEFDLANDLIGGYAANNGNIMYSINGGYTWLPVIPQNLSFKRMYQQIEYNWTEGMDEIEPINANSTILYGYDQPWFLPDNFYQGRDYDETTRFVVDLDFLGNSEQVQFMFVYAHPYSSESDGNLIDNFSITESQSDFVIPTDKIIMADADDSRIKFFFSVKNDDNYLSDTSVFYLYCSSDTLIDSSDTLFYYGPIYPLMPYANQHIIIDKPVPNNYGNYNYVVYELDPLNTQSESDETNNIGYFDLAMDTASNYIYPMLFDFEEKYIDGWTYYLDSTNGHNGHRFRSQELIGDIWTVGESSGEWFLDSRWTFWPLLLHPTHFLEGPSFDFSNLTNIQVSFDFMCVGYNDLSDGQGANMQYSTDGGTNWYPLTTAQDPAAVNWYNLSSVESLDNQPGWGDFDGWNAASFNLSFLGGEPDVRFRYRYKSIVWPNSTTPNGFRLDNFNIAADYGTYLPLLTLCEGDSLLIFGNYESEAGMYSMNLTSSTIGMDSVIFQEVVLFDSIQDIDIALVCIHDSYTFPDGVTLHDITADMVYNSVLSSSNGCDSIIQIMIDVIPLNVTVTETPPLLAAQPGQGSYQWLDCNNNFAPIPGQTLNWMNMSAPGGYAVMITSTINGCIDTSSCYGAFVVDVPESGSNMITLFPNPTTGTIYLNSEQIQDELHLTIFNMLGEVVLQKTYYNTGNVVFDLEGSTGMYVVEITSAGNTIQTFRVMKE